MDANLMAQELLAQLKSAGQSISSATFTVGDQTDDLIKLAAGNCEVSPADRLVTINGKNQVVPQVLSYEQICERAGQPGRMLSVTYSHALGDRSGLLSKGQEITVTNGTIINAVDTSNA